MSYCGRHSYMLFTGEVKLKNVHVSIMKLAISQELPGISGPLARAWPWTHRGPCGPHLKFSVF